MKPQSVKSHKKPISSSDLVKHLRGIADKEGISFAETVRRTMESSSEKDLKVLLDAFYDPQH